VPQAGSDVPVAPGRLLMIGCGNMGGAMLSRWLETGLPADRVTVVSPSGRAVPGGVRVLRAVPPPDDGPFDTILLALKPQKLAELAATPLEAHAPGLLLSTLAGVEEPALAAACPRAAAVVRAMPNLPVALGRGVVALHSRTASVDTRAVAEALMRPLGLVEWIADEAMFDAVTALAGSGPAFLYRFVDALAGAGAALGLPREQAGRLALATVEGAALLAARSEDGPAMLADKVASPGGSTREGLNVLDRGDTLLRLLTETLQAAERRNREMAAAAREPQGLHGNIPPAATL